MFLGDSERGNQEREKILNEIMTADASVADTSTSHSDGSSCESSSISNEIKVVEISDRRYNKQKKRYEWLTQYDDGLQRSWQPRSDFVDDDGKVNDAFSLYEKTHPYDNTSEKNQKKRKRNLSDASQSVLDHTKSVASSQISSSSIQSIDDTSSLSDKIGTETKKEIRSSRIFEREKEKK